MKFPRDLSGASLIRTLCRDWGYRRVHQKGSHVILETDDPSPQRISVPAHQTLRMGTLHGIVRSVAQHKGVSRENLLSSLS